MILLNDESRWNAFSLCVGPFRWRRLAAVLAIGFVCVLPTTCISGEEEPLGAPARTSEFLANEIALSSSRVTVGVTFRNPYNNQSGTAIPLRQGDEFAYFYFSSPDNPEVFIKVLGSNDPAYFQLFVGGLTDFEYTVSFLGCNSQRVSFFKPAGQFIGTADARSLSKSCGGGPSAPSASFSFSPSSPFTNDTVQFTDSSTGAPTQWTWSFGDSSSSTNRNPTHGYASAGTYTVQLVASNSAGSSSTTRTIAVQPRTSSTTVTLNIQNNMVTTADVSVNDSIVGTIPPGQTRSVVRTGETAPIRVRVASELPGYSTGGTIPGSGSFYNEWLNIAVNATQTFNLSTTADFIATSNQAFYAPLILNTSAIDLKPVVNVGLNGQFVCDCVVPRTGNRIFIGYYNFYSNSSVRAYNPSGYPNSGYLVWNSPLTSFWNRTSGAVNLDANQTPSAQPSDSFNGTFRAPPLTRIAPPIGGGEWLPATSFGLTEEKR